MTGRRTAWWARAFFCLLAGLSIAPLVQPAAAEPLTLRGQVEPPGTRVELLRFESDHERGVRRLAGEHEPDPVATASVARDGTLTLGVPAPGLWRLELSAPGRIRLGRSLRPLAVSASLPRVELPADAGLPLLVRGPDGRPLADARVWVRRSLGGWEAWRQRNFFPAARRGVSDERGRLVLPRRPEEPMVVQAWAPGLPLTEVEVEEQAESAEIRFATGLVRPLRVTDADGEPVAGVLVRVDGSALAATGENGSAAPVLADGAASEIELVAADGRRTTVELPSWNPRSDEQRSAGPPRAELTLPAAKPLAGRVIDAAGEQAVPGAIVWIWNDEGEAVEADDRGAFTLTWPPGDRWLVAVAPGYRWRSVKTGAIEPGQPVTLELEPSVRISGRAVDEAGEPVAAAVVRVRRHEQRPRVWRSGGELFGTSTASDGSFEVRGLDPGRSYELRVEAPGLAAGEVTAAAGESGLEVVLATASGVAGRVLDAYGAPFPGARVRLFPLLESAQNHVEFVDGERQTDHEVLSGPQGRFEAGRLAPGLYDLEVLAAGWAPLFRPGLEVPEDGDLDLGDLVLEPGATIDGRVVDAEERPVEGAEVRFHSYVRTHSTHSMAMGVSRSGRFPLLAQSGYDGRFAIEHQPEDRELQLAVSHPGHLGEVVTAQPGEEVVVRLRPAGAVFGRVASTTGAPVPDASVEVRVEQRTETLQATSTTTHYTAGRSGEDGAFTVDKVPPGTARITATAPGFAASEPVEVEIGVGQRVGPLHLPLDEPAEVFGRVFDADGEPLAGAQVLVIDPLRSSHRFGRSDAEGDYRIEGLTPGVAEVRAEAPASGARVERSVELRAGEQRLDLRLAVRPAIGGRVVDGEGRPVPGARVSVEAAERQPETRYSSTSVITGSDGGFLVAVDRRGRYRLRASGEAGIGETEVEVGDEPRLGVDLELRKLGGAIVGELVGIDPEAAAEVMVTAVPSGGGQVLFGRGTASGSYRVPRVPAGDWRVRAEDPEQQRQAVGEVQVGDDEAVLDLVFPPTLSADSWLEGQLLGSGRPVSDAQVGLVPVDPSRGTRPAATVTDAAGRFRFDELVAGRYELMVAGFASTDPPPEVEVGDGAPLLLDLPSVPVAGRVVSPSGQPLGGVWVMLRPPGEQRLGWVGRSHTDAEGRFHFAHAAPGRYVLFAQALGGSERRPVEIELVVEPPGRTGVEIVLE